VCLCVAEVSALSNKSPATTADGRSSGGRGRLGSATESESSYGGGGGGAESSESSPAPATTLRPRFGKEYQRVERRHHRGLVDNGGNVTPSPATTSSSNSTVFTFDVASMASRMSFVSDNPGGGSDSADSPRSPSVAMLRHGGGGGPEHVYMNIGFPSGRAASPVIVEARPPGSPYSYAGAEQSNALLNYAEIDLRHASSSSNGPRGDGGGGIVTGSRAGTERVEYAMIDMVATVAAARVGKEHAKEREDSLRRKDGLGGLRRSDSEGWRRRGNTPTPRTPTSKSASLGKGSSSKDRKFSSPM
jgi:hypothetical protein